MLDHDSHAEFLRGYFKKNRYQSITTMDFVSLFKETFPAVAEKIDFEEWLHGVGPCPALAPVDTSLIEAASVLAKDWLTVLTGVKDLPDEEAKVEVEKKLQVSPNKFKEWDPKQKLCFLSELRVGIDSAKSKGDEVVWDERSAGFLQQLYEMDSNRNSEIRFAWCRLALSAGYSGIFENVKEFVSTQGRMKFVRPLFSDLHKAYPKGSLAADLFAEVKGSYHSIALKLIERDLAQERK